MGNFHVSSSTTTAASPIDTIFELPSSLPPWPPGGGFAKGIMDLGGLEIRSVTTFTKIWTTHDGGPDNLGATFFAASSIPSGFSALGCYAQPNNRPLFGWVLVARDVTSSNALASPVDYTLVWSSEDSGQDGHGYFWLPVAPDGYRAVGHVVTGSPEKPGFDEVCCVRTDLTDDCELDESMWGSGERGGIDVYGLRPVVRGTGALGVSVGTFTARPRGTSSTTIACLKNKNTNLYSSMPNLSQINALAQAYAPLIYFHKDESYLPSSVSWFFENGALLFAKLADGLNSNSNPTPIDPAGSNLPQGGSNDGAYWLGLPPDNAAAGERIKKGDISTATSYLNIKPMLGATFTDIAVWVFYPFNGPARAKLELVNLPLGRIGEHVGDWEHVTLRVSNLSGELRRVYLSEHSAGLWVEASQLEYPTTAAGSNKPAVYSSLNGHGFYPKAGLVMQGNTKLGIGIRNDTGRGGYSVDSGAKFEVVAAEYLAAVGPPWLNYMREWGPRVEYDMGKEMERVGRLLPKKVRAALEEVVRGLPAELTGEEGPSGPKGKDSWSMDEKVAN